MAGYVPRVLPDETLYSLLARAAAHRGVTSAASFAAELFGRRHVVSSFDLPGHLAALAAWFDGHEGLDEDGIIDRLTLFPFYTAFASDARRAAARARMAGTMTGVHTGLGVTTFRIPPLRSLRFCAACTVEWDAAGEEWRWRRSHQLSGVLVCPDHGVPLRASCVSLDAGDRHRFIAASRATCSHDASPVVTHADPDCMHRLSMVARAARELLDCTPAAAELNDLVESYRHRLADVGLMRSARKVDQVALERAFLAFWREVPSLLPRLVTNGVPVGGWLMAMVRSPRRAVHPVLHLLLTHFLDSLDSVERPFGGGPWPCRNPFAPHHGAAVIDIVEVRRDGPVRYGDFRCSCGYHYTRSLSPEGLIGSARYRSFGPLLKPALIRLVSEGASLRAAASRAGIDPKTLMREAAMLGVEVPWSTRPSGSVRPLRRADPQAGKPRSSTPPGRRMRNWNFIDRRLERLVERVVPEIRDARPVCRVTVTEIERRVAARGWLAKRRLRLPRTWRTMQRHMETIEDFRARRLECTIDRMMLAAPDSTPSDVLRAAGLPTDWLPAVRAALQGRPHVSRAVAR